MIRKKNYSLLKNNTFGIDVKCNEFVEYDSLEELKYLVKTIDFNNNVLHIGGGSNLLFINDYNGTILHSAIVDIEHVEDTDDFSFIRVGAGLKMDDFVAYCVENDLFGAENLSYIPGEVGAAPVQNVGAYGVEATDIIDRVELIDIETADMETKNNAECQFGYRNSKFKNEWKNKYIVHHVVFRLRKNRSFNLNYGNLSKVLCNPEDITLQKIRNTIIDIRKNKLPEPSEIGSAGSFFKNPVVEEQIFRRILSEYPEMPYYNVDNGMIKIPAGWLIEKCGLKGKKHKNAAVYEKQALILVNCGGATGSDVKELSEIVMKAVMDKFGISITPEVCFIS